MDFAPTFATMLDVDLPDVDGRPIHEIITSNSLREGAEALQRLSTTEQAELTSFACAMPTSIRRNRMVSSKQK